MTDSNIYAVIKKKEYKQTMEYNLIRTKRKTVAIHILNGIVEVRAPLKKPISEIDRFVNSKEKWISDKLALSRQQVKQRDNFSLDYGDIVPCFGDSFVITEKEHIHHDFDDEHFYVPPGLKPEQIKCACIRIYRKLAKNCLTAKTIEFAGLMSISPVEISITGAKTRWGSCSAKRINYTWRLVMADEDVIDYVVVHELTHLIEMNHSKRFWAIVESFIPDYKERSLRLKELQRRLESENWS